MKAALLPDRGVVKVLGDDARHFLNGLLTADIGRVAPGHARFAALLTPQGKIVVDCLVAEAPAADGGGFFLDCPRSLAAAFATKLNFYKLRAKVMVEDLSETLGVLALWEQAKPTSYGLCYADPRFPALGLRTIVPPHLAERATAEIGAVLVDAAAYEAHRITLGIPRGGLDFTYGDAFPHETDMDQLGGVDFDKGCYVGQEVVSRMEHRGTARTRTVAVDVDGPAPNAGAAVTAGDKTIGTLGSSAPGHAIALLRLDRASEAVSAGVPLTAGGATLRIVGPAWAHFPMPAAAKAAE